jgi:NADPH:quinone reductase-like Zn-dependent oxidoreductase
MPRAVKFDGYGGIDVLRVVEVDRPGPGPEQVIIRMKAAGINPGEAAIREGAFAKQWPAPRLPPANWGSIFSHADACP